jgi:hypothetical protein
MKTSSSNVTTVNIYPEAFGVNNGFGADYAASLINQLGRSR